MWAARHRYPYIALNLPIQEAMTVWNTYDQAAAVAGYRSGPEQRGYLVRCHVAETEEKALRNAREFMWMQGELIGLQHPVWATPSGYLGNWARRGLAELRAGYRTDMGARASFEDHLKSLIDHRRHAPAGGRKAAGHPGRDPTFDPSVMGQ